MLDFFPNNTNKIKIYSNNTNGKIDTWMIQNSVYSEKSILPSQCFYHSKPISKLGFFFLF